MVPRDVVGSGRLSSLPPMTKGPSPLLGYNTNVRHKGRLYHIQTEDSGIHHPHVITHLFADGGRIIASRKTSYSEYVGADGYSAVVKKLMQEQHKAMFIALRDGLYDEEDEPSIEHPLPTPAARPAVPKPPSGPSPVDVEALEQAAAARAKETAPLGPDTAQDLVAPKTPPPPPRARSKSSSTSTASGATPAATPRRSDNTGRYQTTKPTRPSASSARRAAAAAPPAARSSDSIFGSDLLSEKSLDEVILSYLAEDLEENE